MSSSKNIPVGGKKKYNREKWGLYGELGQGANAKIKFLQTVITAEELEYTTLIRNIPGSEKWNVKDLFQRDVDSDRVMYDILPYFQSDDKVKYFNPLTLIILPVSENGRNVLKEVEYLPEQNAKEDGREYIVYEKENYYKMMVARDAEEFGKIEWNDKKCYVVAIDGQHRLSALKRWKNTPHGELLNWKIPVVFLTIMKVDDKIPTANMLEIVRKTFVYINTKAVIINPARKILLDDESVTSLCTQELIQYSHSNDSKNIEKRKPEIIPLMFYDWRGETKRHKRVPGPASIKNIDEINLWFSCYILGDDYSERQIVELELKDMVPPLEGYGSDKTLTHEDSERIRGQFNKTVLLGITNFLQKFTPYEEYIKECRQIENESNEESDVSQHAFMKLRFGSHNASQDQVDEVAVEYENLVNKFDKLKNEIFPETILRDIGMRAVMHAFGIGKKHYKDIKRKSITWHKYSEWILPAFNSVYSHDWFNSYEKLDKKHKDILTHVVFDDSGSIINYKHKQIPDAFGALMLLIVFKELMNQKKITNDEYQEVWDENSYRLSKTVERGFKKFFKATLKDDFRGTISDFNELVQRKAEKATAKRIKMLAKYFEIE